MVLHPRTSPRRGLSRVELLVLIAIGTTFIGACVPQVQRVHVSSMRSQCTNNLKQIGLGLHNFESVFKRLPPLYGGVAGADDQASRKFARIWASTHVFILPYIEQDNLYKSMAVGSPAHYIPNRPHGADAAMNKVVPTYVCPLDPSMNDGLIGTFGGSSYAVNAQVFAPLEDEDFPGSGKMLNAPTPDYCDRGATIARLKDGSSNVIGFMHTYGLCGPNGTGSAWGYTNGRNGPPGAAQSLQPWSRATYIGQIGMVAEGQRTFQMHPSRIDLPYDPTKCDPRLSVTPHTSVLMILLMDASVRGVEPTMSAATWNMACLPNDGNALPSDW